MGFVFTGGTRNWHTKKRVPRKLKKHQKKKGVYVKPPRCRTTHREIYFSKPAYSL